MKFRAFWKGKMYRVLQIDFRLPETVILTNETLDFFNVSMSDIIIMPFTGILDKNGEEIYDGDIIQIPNDYDTYGMNAGEIYEVYFAFGGFRMKPKRFPNAKGFYVEDNYEYEKLGNKYENPELLN